ASSSAEAISSWRNAASLRVAWRSPATEQRNAPMRRPSPAGSGLVLASSVIVSRIFVDRAASIGAKTGSFHDRRPARGVLRHPRRQVGGAAAGRLEAELGQPLAQLGVGERLVDRGVELAH